MVPQASAGKASSFAFYTWVRDAFRVNFCVSCEEWVQLSLSANPIIPTPGLRGRPFPLSRRGAFLNVGCPHARACFQTPFLPARPSAG